MARFDEVSDRLAFWQQKPRYDGAEYDLSHLKPLDRSMAAHKGESIPLRFRFSYHCCTDKPGKRDLGARIREDTRPEEDRYFCPVRWFLIPVDACVDRYARRVGGRRRAKGDSYTGRRKRRLV